MMGDQAVMAMQMTEEQAAAVTANLKAYMEQQRKDLTNQLTVEEDEEDEEKEYIPVLPSRTNRRGRENAENLMLDDTDVRGPATKRAADEPAGPEQAAKCLQLPKAATTAGTSDDSLQQEPAHALNE